VKLQKKARKCKLGTGMHKGETRLRAFGQGGKRGSQIGAAWENWGDFTSRGRKVDVRWVGRVNTGHLGCGLQSIGS